MGVPAETKILFPLSSTSSSLDDDDVDRRVAVEGTNKRRLLSKQLSMKETTREAKWEKRRQQILNRRRKSVSQCRFDDDGDDDEIGYDGEGRNVKGRVTDEDLDELRGSIELGFGFNEEDGGHNLCVTLPALDLYFAVNRQFSDTKLWSPAETPTPASSAASNASVAGSTPSPRSPNDQEHDSWKICNPGDTPQDVKLRLRQWAQVVACSIRQCRQCC